MKRYLIERHGRIANDVRKVIRYLEEQNLPFEHFTAKQIQRGKIDIDSQCVVIGGIPSIMTALDRIGTQRPQAVNYPKELKNYYHRKIWKQTLSKALVDQKSGFDYFIKPERDFKSFTGFRLQEIEGQGKLRRAFNKFGPNYSIDCSEVVEFVSEYRVYIVDGKAAFVSYYWGDDQPIDTGKVENIVKALTIGGNYQNTALDIGILDSGEIAIIEHNGGFSIDSYECPYDIYARLLINGWKDIVD